MKITLIETYRYRDEWCWSDPETHELADIGAVLPDGRIDLERLMAWAETFPLHPDVPGPHCAWRREVSVGACRLADLHLGNIHTGQWTLYMRNVRAANALAAESVISPALGEAA